MWLEVEDARRCCTPEWVRFMVYDQAQVPEGSERVFKNLSGEWRGWAPTFQWGRHGDAAETNKERV
jgi:hypothetical protein